MKKLKYIYIPLGMGILILLVLFSLRHLNGEKIIDETRTVYIKKNDEGFQLYRNGKPFFIQGAAGISHFKELAEAGGNTIRVYDTINLDNILNEAQEHNLAVIVDIPIPRYQKEFNPYLNTDSNNVLKKNVELLVKKHKSHPALLMWNLGNEVNYPKVLFKNSFIKTFNELIEIIHRGDPEHPVSTTFNGKSVTFSIYLHSWDLDIVGYNIFGDLKNLEFKTSIIFSLIKPIPYYISEWGSDGPWESELNAWRAPIEPTSTKKIEQIEARYKIIAENSNGAFLGSLFFYWGNKHERTYTWFSLFHRDFKSEIIKVLKELWNNTNSSQYSIGLDYMLLDERGSADNIVFSSNEIKSAELKFHGLQNDSNLIKWEIYPEAWTWSDKKNYIVLDPSISLEKLFLKSDKNKVEFITPSREGPYRIFAYVYDKNGYFATTNTPFYVLKTNDQN